MALSALSSNCPFCGNIEFFGERDAPLAILSRRVLAQWKGKKKEFPKNAISTEKFSTDSLTESSMKPLSEPGNNPLLRAKDNSDAMGVRGGEILAQYQVEWQLWAAVARNFSQTEHHAAYLNLLANTLQFDQGISRYQTHVQTMAQVAEEHWQIELCHKMLAQISTVAIMQCERSVLRGPSARLPLPRSLVLFAAFMLGMILMISLPGPLWRGLHVKYPPKIKHSAGANKGTEK